MAIFRGVGGSGDSSDNSFLQEVTAQANAASASATAAANSATSALNTELTSASFNTSDGVLTLTKQDGDTVTADLDGRFLTSYTETDPVFTAHVANGITATNISNWNTAYNNHITAVDYSGSTLTLTQQDGGTLTTTINGALGSTLVHSGSTKIEAISSGVTVTGDITVSGTVDGRDLATDGTKLDGIEANATADQTDAEIKTAYENNADTNAFTDADHTKLDNIEANATADQTGAEIKSAYEAVADTNAFTDAEKTKLLGIEASADVTDATNVTAAGALMDSEVTNLAQVKAFDSSDYATAAQGTLATNALPKSGGQMTGNITFSSTQTVDGRDLSVDGIKLDSIEAGATGDQTGAEIKTAYEAEADTNAFTDADHTKLDGLKGTLTHNYWDSLQWASGANRALTTTLTTYGDTQFVKHSGTTYKTYVDLSVDLIHNSTYSTNDAYGHLAVTAPSSEPTINMGTCSTFSTGVSYIRGFSVVGDWTEYFSPYIGISKNSNGSSPMSHPYKWVYNPYQNATTVWVSLYTNAPSNGDTIYLHPFDWESSGTVINGETLTLDSSSGSSVNNRRDFKIYLGRFDSRVSYKFLAKENSSTDVVSLDTLRMFTTEYEV